MLLRIHTQYKYHTILLDSGQRESNPMSSARQAVWLTTVLHAAQLILSFNS
ncbi:hypothetical protein T12_945 [Trichinella patagoniensis]|uniref:Uncharacterized protein n=1 Tax=Trichinella patagoniensis TaxID=990121 RepID=A0A0V0XTW0_9BILA|nr:hypothetical protein T12_945 [Trichinella patagoniensis]